ncbi:hypothetical protein AWB71_01376 [Caballeronia peredens]|nr:hypothetical protein AWB71_01376 [Caballeronia peredens]
MMNDPVQQNDAQPLRADAGAEVGAQLCARCGAAFRCGTLAGDASCWCATLPALPHDMLSPGAACLCPACLTRLTAQSGRASRPA